ncbi:hypothetical protein B9Q03_08725 [Candidatus Marsarchaeota G2 archaeon OSP_D]|uniref:Uncharacterized protein n=1 Tax=Candidatus Marsarchaeota G2 archaeon OSP_D TaxID=1978157 RepID=A0A2R6AS07_9ARCH|nr:MAG: hypothetical protein B9Q03_08725 [Candidatus Marsarchaeota G2 archaeon OSP_D]
MGLTPSQRKGASRVTPHLASSLSLVNQGVVGEVSGEAPQAHPKGGTHSTLLRRIREALRPRSKAKPQMGQHTTRSYSVGFLLILPREKHLRDEL